MPCFRSAATALTLAAGLGGCALVDALNPPPPPKPAPAATTQFEIRPAEPEAPQAAAEGTPLLPRPKPAPPRRSDPVPQGARQEQLPASPAPPATATPLPGPPPKLVGLSQPETLALLGPPGTETAAGPARIWQYQGPGCKLEIEFFLDVSRNAFYALNTTAAGPDGTPQQSERCVQDVMDDRSRPR
jgi:hypothetical protein